MKIYQEIWDKDQEGNGIKAILRGDRGETDNGYVKIDFDVPEEEDNTTTTKQQHQLLPDVQIPKEKRNTYTLCEKLFNNYTLDSTESERSFTYEELFEIHEFISSVKDLGPMRLARDFAAKKLVDTGKIDDTSKMTDALWTYIIHVMWFREYKEGQSTPARNGFEHVFVGEKKKKNVTGYHFWYKYWRDDGGKFEDEVVGPKDRMSFEDLKVSNNDNVPEFASFSFKWKADDPEDSGRFTNDDEGSSDDEELFKPRSSFFIGCSPEGLMALGIARFFDDSSGNKVSINGNVYNLVIFKDKNGGVSINTFYPKLVEVAVPIEKEDVRIEKALVDVQVGEEANNETVTLKNLGGTAVSINDWKIAGPSGDNSKYFFRIEDSTFLGPEESRTFKLVDQSLESGPARLRNSQGSIKIYDSNDTLIDKQSYKKQQLDKGIATFL